MKKNLMTVLVLALVLVNLVLTAILTISILPETKKANELITQVCNAIDLELNSGATSAALDVPLEQVANYDITGMTINLKDGPDGKPHYVTLDVSLAMDTKNDGYKEYGETMDDRASLIKTQINTIVSGYTYEEFNADTQGAQDKILKDLQTMFDSDFIIRVGFPKVTCQ
ncbi:MAG: flagellar basal body-associated FliL family protein [Eubacterium sp.]|jgi:hypothetical protein|nr:flagellar basal body-associated FliL family protein [Eubacterium sp.]